MFEAAHVHCEVQRPSQALRSSGTAGIKAARAQRRRIIPKRRTPGTADLHELAILAMLQWDRSRHGAA